MSGREEDDARGPRHCRSDHPGAGDGGEAVPLFLARQSPQPAHEEELEGRLRHQEAGVLQRHRVDGQHDGREEGHLHADLASRRIEEDDTAEAKLKVFRECGLGVSESTATIGATIAPLLGVKA